MARSLIHNVFPELSSHDEIIAKIGLLEKNWLEDVSLIPPVHILQMMNGLQFFRVQGTMAVFQENPDALIANEPNDSLLTAMHQLNWGLVFVVAAINGNLHVLMGVPMDAAAGFVGLLERLTGPGLFQPVSGREFPLQNHISSSMAITGIPDIPAKDSQPSASARIGGNIVDQLVSSLAGENWIYLVQAFPAQRATVRGWIQNCACEIKDIKEAFLSREFQKSNRLASHYVQLLEHSIRRFRLGLQLGMWQQGAYVMSARRDTAIRAAAILASMLAGDKSHPEPVRVHRCQSGEGIPAFINGYHSRELLAFIKFPSREFPGFCLREHARFDVDVTPETGQPISLGTVLLDGRPSANAATVAVDRLTRHALVAGVTGSGKTNTIFHLLIQLWQTRRLPFLVIEPAKAEYRALTTVMNDLLIFTLGEERPGQSCPFRLNPFYFPEGISLQTHLDFLKAVFNSSFVMYAPMPYVLEECLHAIYEDKGWNLVTSINPRGHHPLAFPLLSDLYAKIDPMVDRLGYQDRTTQDIKAALKTRIRNLCLGGKGLMLNTPVQIDWAELMAQPTVLELKYLGNDEEKAFMMGLILMAVWEYYEARQDQVCESSESLRHLTVIEEAHRLLKNVPTEKSSEEQSNIKGKGVETFCNLLAEIRAYGEGVLVSEQIPVKLAPDVIKNSSLKIMHRLVAREDREVMGDTMNLDRPQKRQAGSLSTGQGIFYREGMDRPMLIQVPVCGIRQQAGGITAHQVARHMADRFYRKHPELLITFPACVACRHYQSPECSRIRRDVEMLKSNPGWAQRTVQFLLPCLLNLRRDDTIAHLESVWPVDSEAHYCLIAHVLQDYVLSRGDYYQWPFAQVAETIRLSQLAIGANQFAGTLVKAFQQMPRQRHPQRICQAHCQNPCMLAYDAAVLAKDPVIHNRLVDLLASPIFGPRFYHELKILLIEFLEDYIPAEPEQRRNLAICYLIQKLSEHQFSLKLQQQILTEFSRTIQQAT